MLKVSSPDIVFFEFRNIGNLDNLLRCLFCNASVDEKVIDLSLTSDLRILKMLSSITLLFK